MSPLTVLFSILVVLTLGGLAWLLLEPHLPRLSIWRLSRSGATKLTPEDWKKIAAQPNSAPHAGYLPPPSPEVDRVSLRVLFFSDLHAGYLFVTPEKILRLLDGLDFDVCLFGGDLANRPKYFARGLKWLRTLARHLARRGIPCYAVRGNHDAGLSPAALLDAGFTPLENQSASLTVRGRTYSLLGLSDPKCDWLENRGTKAEPPPCASLPEVESKASLVLAHNPDQLLRLKPANTPYLLAGHFHGGQIRMPFALEFRLLRKEVLAKEGLVRGPVQRGGITAYLSRGVGCVLLPFRFLSPPEVALLDVIDPPVQEG